MLQRWTKTTRRCKAADKELEVAERKIQRLEANLKREKAHGRGSLCCKVVEIKNLFLSAVDSCERVTFPCYDP